MWYIDRKFSHHMSRYRRKFHFLNKTKSGRVVFEGSETNRVLGSEKANLGEKRKNVEDIWLIEGIQHNILSVRQMVNGGKEVILNCKRCIIWKEGSKRVIARGVKTLDNV